MDYNGWALFDKVLLVCREHYKGDIYQAYLCDPNNKKQIENARRWGSWTEYGEYDKETKTYPNRKEHPAVEFEFENNGFDFQLYDSAGGSSQGGKLSFWNCLVTKDNKTFMIGINADLLINLLLTSTFVNGKCAETVSFARCKGGVGVLHKGMKEYQMALNDMDKKQQVKKKTSKHVIGCNYVTLTEDDIYLGDFYQWYEPIYEESKSRYSYWSLTKFAGYRKLKKPIVQKLFEHTEKFTSTKEYCSWYNQHSLYNWRFKEKLPARMKGDIELKLDATNEDWEEIFADCRKKKMEKRDYDGYKFDLVITLSTNPNEPFNFDKDFVEYLAKHNIRVED